MAKGEVIASKALSFIDSSSVSIEMVDLVSCDPSCLRVVRFHATEGAVVPYPTSIDTHPLDGSAVRKFGKSKGFNLHGICEHQDYCGSSDATRRRACFTK